MSGDRNIVLPDNSKVYVAVAVSFSPTRKKPNDSKDLDAPSEDANIRYASIGLMALQRRGKNGGSLFAYLGKYSGPVQT